MTSQAVTAEVLPEDGSDKMSQKLAAKPIATGGGIAAFVPTTLDETWRLAQILAKSQMAPKAYDNKPEKIMVGIMAGLELGLTPMTALQTIAVIGNNPAVWGDGALALVQSSGLLEDIEETFDEATKTATCMVKRAGRPRATIRTFSFEDARLAGLLNKAGPWKDYPKRMAQMRARSWALRDTFADVLKGIGIGEEVRDRVTMGEITAHTENKPLSAELLRQQAEAPAADPIDGEYEVVAAAPAEPQQEALDWIAEETRIRDAIFLANGDQAALEQVEKEFLSIAAQFPEAARKSVQAEIDAALTAAANQTT